MDAATNLIKAHEKKAVESEKCILAVCMSDNKTISLASNLIRKEFFYETKNGTVWAALLKIYNREGAVDQVMLTEVLRAQKTLESIGGVVYLADLTANYWTSPTTIESHCKIVREYWLRRSYIKSVFEQLHGANDSPETTSSLMDQHSQAMLDLSTKLGGDTNTHVGVGLDDTVAEWGTRVGASTGISELNSLVGGFIPGDTHIYAGRASMGKTALAVGFVRNTVFVDKAPALFFSLEMSKSRVQTRLIGAEARISPYKLFMAEELTLKQSARVQKVIETMKGDCPLFIDDQAGISIEQIRFRTRRYIQEYGVKVVFIDYLQLVTYEGKAQTREQEVARVAEGLKGIGKDLNVCVVALAQLSRETDRRVGNRPRLSDLRESGAIEQAADIVGFIHRPEYYGTTYDEEHGDLEGKAFLYIDKHRNGEIGEVELEFSSDYAQFTEPQEVV
jgi:replicative DNA helicase